MDEIKNAQHVYHHSEENVTTLNIGIEKNTKGFNWSVTVVGAKSVEEAIQLISEANFALKKSYGDDNTKPMTDVISTAPVKETAAVSKKKEAGKNDVEA